MIDFPASPTPGQVFNPGTGPIYTWDGIAWNLTPVQVKTAERRNRVVNPAMQISTENGNTLVSVGNSYPADQFLMSFSGAMVIGAQRKQITTPNGSRDRLQITVPTIDASMTASDYVAIFSRIEGINVADFLWGTAAAKQAILRFGFKAPAGTYSVAIQNSGPGRSYIAQFTISAGQANTDTEQIIVIPGDVTGTWLVDNSFGLQFVICLACGTTYSGVLGWQAGNVLAGPGQFNGAGSTANVFELFDFGLYLDPDRTGIPPKWELPDEAMQLLKCQRYYRQQQAVQLQVTDANTQVQLSIAPELRTIPTVASTGTATWVMIGTNGVRQSSTGTFGGVTLKFNARM